ncbi:hypothetical protein NE237_009907 [Protea cynaroides]|uniref:MATH domain-containing protein n=1 Tax=Protea cynaroides TaxID=273540 RepID=A0A9Q0KYN5_9MAGN|nr:hypothetical protein NE237_009907 [Protea cynaroides]
MLMEGSHKAQRGKAARRRRMNENNKTTVYKSHWDQPKHLICMFEMIVGQKRKKQKRKKKKKMMNLKDLERQCSSSFKFTRHTHCRCRLIRNQQEDDDSQPMEVAQAEMACTVHNQLVEYPPSSRFKWTIENFSRLNTKKHYSDIFLVGGYKWRMLIYPKGNNVDHLSVYLAVGDLVNLPYGWSRDAQFSLVVINKIHSKNTVRKDTQHQFNDRERDWGFTKFMLLSELNDPGRGFRVNDTVLVEAEVSVPKYVCCESQPGGSPFSEGLMRPLAPRVSPPPGQTFMEKDPHMSSSPGRRGKATGENPGPTFIASLKRADDVVRTSPGTLLADSETALPHFPGTTVPDARAPRGMCSLEAPTEVPGMGIPYTHIPASRYYDLLRGVYVRDEFIHKLSTELVGVEHRLEEQREASLAREKELLASFDRKMAETQKHHAEALAALEQTYQFASVQIGSQVTQGGDADAVTARNVGSNSSAAGGQRMVERAQLLVPKREL